MALEIMKHSISLLFSLNYGFDFSHSEKLIDYNVDHHIIVMVI